jgi:menaquinone-dependent protoporphyrinogen IX oxidase
MEETGGILMKTAVVYRSKTGFAAKYANWISEELDGDIMDAQTIKIDALADYDTIVYVGGIYMGRVKGFSQIKKNYSKLADKKIVLVGVGALSPDHNSIQINMTEVNLSAPMRENVKWFYLRGGYDFTKIQGLDRIIMRNVVSVGKKYNHGATDQDSADMINAFNSGTKLDYTDRDNIEPIIDYILDEYDDEDYDEDYDEEE